MGLEQKSNLPSSKDMQVVGFAMPRRKPDGSPAPDRIRKPDIRPVPDEDTVEQEPVDIQTAARPPFAIDTPVNTQAPARAGTTTLPRPTTPAEAPSFPDTGSRAKDKDRKPPKTPTSLGKRIALWASGIVVGLGSLAGIGIGVSKVINSGGDSSPDGQTDSGKLALTIPDNFDPSASTGTLQFGKNATTMTIGEYEKLGIPLSTKEKVTIPIPIQFPDGSKPTIKYEKLNSTSERRVNVKHDPDNYLNFTSEKTEKVSSLIRLTWANNSISSSGPIIFSSFDGMVNFTHSSIFENADGTLQSVMLFISTKDEKGNETDIQIDGQNIRPIAPSPRFVVEGSTSRAAPDYAVKKATPLFEALDGNKGILIRARSFRTDNGIRTEGSQNLEIATASNEAGNLSAIFLKPQE